MALTVITSLLQRAGQYEQGTAIRPIVTVCLELQATDVQFSPPLSTHSALVSVPEAVQKWIDEYMGLAKLVPRFGGSGEGGTFQEELCGDSELKGAVSKISAHLETNARHCQVGGCALYKELKEGSVLELLCQSLVAPIASITSRVLKCVSQSTQSDAWYSIVWCTGCTCMFSIPSPLCLCSL